MLAGGWSGRQEAVAVKKIVAKAKTDRGQCLTMV